MKVDKASLLGLVAALGGITWGLILEGGSVKEILQPTAALIVFGGTFGATLISQPFSLFVSSFRRFLGIFSEPTYNFEKIVESVVELAGHARRNGIVSLEKQVAELPDPFMKKALTLAIDGTESHDIRRIMELEIEQETSRRESEARVLETAGGFAPTIGIIGAVLGLIQVMKHLDDINEVGHGIAVAFVATIYGIAIANLILLPGAKKMTIRAHEQATARYLTLEGVVSLAEGLNPRLIQQRLDAFLEKKSSPASREGTEQSTRTAEA